jgi:Ni,Fe-hydrogenase I small subunit
MSLSLYWLSCGGCGGDSMSLLNAASPNIIELKDTFNIKVLWHPSFAHRQRLGSPSAGRAGILDGSEPLDILCLEGTILRGPGGTGRYDMVMGQPKKDWVAKLAAKAKYVIAVGTCASFGGMGATGKWKAPGFSFCTGSRAGFWASLLNPGSGLPGHQPARVPVSSRSVQRLPSWPSRWASELN